MNNLRTAAQQALEVLENAVEYDYHGTPLTETHAGFNDAATALRAALADPDYWQEEARRYAGNADYWRKRYETLAEPVQEPVAGRAFLERILTAMEGVIDVADRKTDEFDALRSCVIDLTMILHTAPPQRPAEPKQDGCEHCEHPLYAAIKCRVCGRVTEPVQEPYAWMSVGGSIWRHKTTEDDVPLYTAPRKPLAEWQINDLMSDIDPEDRDSWSFRQGVYAAEKHHGVRR